MISAFKKMIENWKDFNGKTSRPDYWWATLAVAIIEMIVGGIVGIIFAFALGKESAALAIIGMIIAIAISVLGVFVAIAGISITVRRLRDAGFPWWFIFANFIPSIGNIAVIVMLCFPSSDKPIIDFGGGTPVTPTAEAPKPAPAPVAPIVDVEPEEAPVVAEAGWTCPSCGATGNSGKFCGSCGTAKPE